MARRKNRRDFLKNTTAATVGFWVAAGMTPGDDNKSPNDKLNFACVGVGGKGSSDTDHVGQLGNIVALCDVDDNSLAKKAEKFPKAKQYHDFRQMLEEMGKQIDAVTVSTADHTHAPASVMAMKLGKHVYCQKPLTHSVYEAHVMRETAAKYKLATQMGNQGTASNGIRQGAEVLRAGAIGAIKEVHVWTNRCGGYWKQAPDIVSRPKESPPIPKNVHWDLFLGPAPERPYSPLYHPFAWRGWRDFGTGALGDMACHTANLAFMALKLGAPTIIAAESSEVNPETFQQWATIHYEFPATADRQAIKLTWWEGKRSGQQNLPPKDLFQGAEIKTSGSLFIGEKGTLYSPDDYGARWVLLPKSEFEGFKPPEPTLPRNPKGDQDLNQKREWVAAIKGGSPAMSNFDYAANMTEAMLLGNIAIVLGKKIEWDAPNLKVVNCPEADPLIKREYRRGWTL